MAQIRIDPFLPDGSIPLAVVGAPGVLDEPPGAVSASDGTTVSSILEEVVRARTVTRYVWEGGYPAGNVVPNPNFQRDRSTRDDTMPGWTVTRSGSAVRWFVGLLKRQLPPPQARNYTFVFQTEESRLADLSHEMVAVVFVDPDRTGEMRFVSDPFVVTPGIRYTLALHWQPELGVGHDRLQVTILLEALDDHGRVVASWRFEPRDRADVPFRPMYPPRTVAWWEEFCVFRRYICSSQILIPVNANRCRLTLQFRGEVIGSLTLHSITMFPSVASFWLQNVQIGSYLWRQPNGTAVTRRLNYADTPYHDVGIVPHTAQYEGVVAIDSRRCYSVPVVSRAGIAPQVVSQLAVDPSVCSSSPPRHYGAEYTGGYTDLVVSAINGRVYRNVSIARDYGLVLRAGYYTDPLPVLLGAGYAVRFPVRHPAAGQPMDTTQFSDIDRWGFSTDTVLLVVQGLDVNDRVVETPFVTPLRNRTRVDPGRGSLIQPALPDKYMVPNARCPDLVRFTNPATVKARVGFEFLQYYEYDPQQPRRPIYRVPPPDWYYMRGWPDQCLALIDPGEHGISTDLIGSQASPGLDSGWTVEQDLSAFPIGWISHGNGRWSLHSPAVVVGQLDGGVASSSHTKYTTSGTPTIEHWLRFGVTAPVTLLSDYVYFVLELRMRVNPGAIYSTAASPGAAIDQRAYLPKLEAVITVVSSTSYGVIQAHAASTDLDLAQPMLEELVSEHCNIRDRNSVYGDWFHFRAAFNANLVGCAGQSAYAVLFLKLDPGVRYQLRDQNADPTVPLIQVDSIQLKMVEMAGGVRVEESPLLEYTARLPVPDSVDNPPTLNGWHVTPSGDMYPRIKPGQAVRQLELTNELVQRAQGNPYAWAVRAAALNGWSGKRIALVYRIPPNELRRIRLTLAPDLVGVLLFERVLFAGRSARLREPALYLVRLMTEDGQRIELNQRVVPPSVDVTLPVDPPASTAVLAYLADVQDCFYTGYTSRIGRFIPFLVRRDRACQVYREHGDGNRILVPAEQFLYQLGTTIYLLPHAVALVDSNGEWAYRPEQWLYAHQWLPTGCSLLRHEIGIWDESELSEGAMPLVIGWVNGVTPLQAPTVVPIDVRVRGGGIRDAESLEPEIRNLLWDVSDWDGALRSGAGHVVIHLPRELLDPNHPLGGYTEQSVHEIVRKYLPAGITFDIEFDEGMLS